MHPAKSVVFFTTATGAGYGLIFWSALMIATEQFVYNFFSMLFIFVPALVLISGGLLSSTLHLGHPERAWRAMSQWRTSWLSREGIAALWSYIPILLLAWVWSDSWLSALVWLPAVLVMVSVMVTVWCTAMIYASLRPIPSWYNPATIAGYIIYSLATGATLLWCLAIEGSIAIPAVVPVTCLIIACLCKFWHWYRTDSALRDLSVGRATGLAPAGSEKVVKVFELPHSSPNYLMKEMGFSVARKYAKWLRVLVVLAAFLLPAVSIYLFGEANILLSPLVLLSCTVGIITERWLFFAEAFHVVSLFYGKNK